MIPATNWTYLRLILLDLFLHHDLLIVDREEDLRDSSFGKTFDLVAEKWLIREFNEWFGHC